MNRIRAFAGSIATLIANFGQNVVQRMAMVPPYLAHLLWLIESKFRDLAKEGYGGNAAVFACIRLLCAGVSEPPLKAYFRQPDGEPALRDPVPYDHPLRRIIMRPNPLMDESRMWEMIMLHLSIVGRSLWWKDRSFLGECIGIYPLRPDRCGPVYAKPADYINGETDNPILAGWSYLVPGTTQYIFLPKNDVMMFILPDPMGESGGIVEGLGPLQALAREVSADNVATEFVGSLMANYAMPGTIISVKGTITSQEDAELIKQAFMRDFGGVRKGLPAVIDNESVISQVGFNLSELEFPHVRRVSESRIAAAFGVPAIMVGLQTGLEAGIKATLGEMREYFTETTCSFYWRRLEAQFTEELASEFGADIVCRFDLTRVRALMVQTLANADRMERAFLRGALMVDEYRAALGLPDLPDDTGKVRLLPPHVTQVDADGQLYGATAENPLEVEEELSPLAG